MRYNGEREAKVIENLFKSLVNQPIHEFPKSGYITDVPARKGVYVVRNRSGVVMHVGQSTHGVGGLHHRLNDHLLGRSSFVAAKFEHEGGKLRNGFTYQYLVVKWPRPRALLEALTIGRLCPKHIGKGTVG